MTRFICPFLCATALSAVILPAYPNGRDDPTSIGWSSIRGYSSKAFGDYFRQKSREGYRIVDIEAGPINGQLRYSAIWQRNTDGRKWKSIRDQTHAQFSQTWESSKATFRLIDQEAYKVGGSWRYAGVWVENKEKIPWVSYRNVTDSEFKKRFQKYSRLGYRMVDIDAYAAGSRTLYSAIWVKDSKKVAWVELRNMSAKTYAAKFKSLRGKGYRVLDVESYRQGGSQKYAAIWVKNGNKRFWKALRDMSAQGFANAWKTAKDEGYRLEDFEAYGTKHGTRYAGVWRQNGNRLSWRQRRTADRLVEAYRKEHGIPGVSVAIGKKGEIVYARGFGHANKKKGEVAHAGTIYRLASVSKPVSALLAMRLIDADKLSVEKSTRSYVPSLPRRHTHTVRQLLEHRSGIRHYKGSTRPKDCEIGDPRCCSVPRNLKGTDGSSTQFSRATRALELFEHDPLMFTPGSRKCYSTHGYTAAAAAFEGATGRTFPSLVEQHFGRALGLSTLRAENRSKAVRERAMIYSSETEEVSRDNLSWKYAGGGLEASASDMARLGLKLFAGEVTKEKTRESFWDSALGHSGAQKGAKSYWKLDFNDDLVVIVLANRNAGDPGALASQLMNLAEK